MKLHEEFKLFEELWDELSDDTVTKPVVLIIQNIETDDDDYQRILGCYNSEAEAVVAFRSRFGAQNFAASFNASNLGSFVSTALDIVQVELPDSLIQRLVAAAKIRGNSGYTVDIMEFLAALYNDEIPCTWLYTIGGNSDINYTDIICYFFERYKVIPEEDMIWEYYEEIDDYTTHENLAREYFKKYSIKDLANFTCGKAAGIIK